MELVAHATAFIKSEMLMVTTELIVISAEASSCPPESCAGSLSNAQDFMLPVQSPILSATPACI